MDFILVHRRSTGDPLPFGFEGARVTDAMLRGAFVVLRALCVSKRRTADSEGRFGEPSGTE